MQQFDLVVGDVLQRGKHWRVDSAKLVNSPQALLMQITLGKEVAVTTLASRLPKPGEAVINVLLRPGEKAVRTDCVVADVSNGAFRIKCPDGASEDGGRRKLVFSRVDGTLLGFGWNHGMQTIATASMLDALPKLRKLAEGTQGTP